MTVGAGCGMAVGRAVGAEVWDGTVTQPPASIKNTTESRKKNGDFMFLFSSSRPRCIIYELPATYSMARFRFSSRSCFTQLIVSVTAIECQLTVCVTCVWAGVDNAWEQENAEARKMLENAAESHTSGARFVRRVLPDFTAAIDLHEYFSRQMKLFHQCASLVFQAF